MIKSAVSLRWLLVISLSLGTVTRGDCPDENTFTITSQNDADKLSQCQSFHGDIILSAAIQEDIALEGPVTIDGGLYAATRNDLTGNTTYAYANFSSNTITDIGGNLTISSMPGLSGLFLPKLRTVGGPVTISDLPVLANLSLESINSVGNLRIISAPQLVDVSIGSMYGGTNSSIGLKHITSATDATIEIRNVSLSDLGGMIDLYNASNLILKDLPNVNSVLLCVGNVDNVEISGNNNLTVYMWEGGTLTGTPQPVIGTLNISGVIQVDPCIWPDVHEFIAIDNPIEYLHFGFKKLQRIEVRNNPNMKRFLPWNGQDFATENIWLWNLTDVLIKDNPSLMLAQSFPRSSNDTLTSLACPFMFSELKDDWYWWEFHMQSLVIDADFDNTYFQSFVDLWNNAIEANSSIQHRPAVLGSFNITSSNPSFSCSQLDNLRGETAAFPGNYSCQGHTLPAAKIAVSTASTLLSWSRKLLICLMLFNMIWM